MAKAAPDVRPDVTDIQREESETDLLKSETKTLSFLLAREHEANEVLRAENGYLNARINYKVNRATDIIRGLNRENRILRDKLSGSDPDIMLEHIRQIRKNISTDYEKTIEGLRKWNDELEDQIRKYLRQGFWARVFNRPVR